MCVLFVYYTYICTTFNTFNTHVIMDSKNFMYVVKMARWQNGWSQKDLAREAEVSPTTVQKIEQGGSIRGKSMVKVLHVLNLDGEITDTLRKHMLKSCIDIL